MTMLTNHLTYKHKKTKNYSTQYIEIGNGPTLFMLPPWANPAEVFTLSIKILQKNYHIISPDYPWWNKQTVSNDRATYDKFVHFIAEFINSFQIKHYYILTYSMSSSFLISALRKNLLEPDKVILISSLLDKTDTRYTPQLQNQLILAKHLLKYEKLIQPSVTGYIYSQYIKDLLTNPIINNNNKKALYKQLIKRLKNVPIKNAYEPALTSPEYIPINPYLFKTKPLIIYNRNEQMAFQHASQRIATYTNTNPIEIASYSHRHFAFDPEKSIPYIVNFLHEKTR